MCLLATGHWSRGPTGAAFLTLVGDFTEPPHQSAAGGRSTYMEPPGEIFANYFGGRSTYMGPPAADWSGRNYFTYMGPPAADWSGGPMI